MVNMPCHIELISTNIEKTEKLYKKLFGWCIIECGLENYRLIKFHPDFPMGGAILKTDKRITNYKQGPLVYIRVKSIDETLKKAVEMGAEVLVTKTIIPERGSWAAFCDPDGNHIAIWKEWDV